MGESKEKLLLCSSEGMLALHMARNYISSNRDKNSVLPYLSDKAFDLEMANDLFQRIESGEINFHFDFATEKLYACSARLGLSLEQHWSLSRQCYALVDIPFFYFIEKEKGITKMDAVRSATKRARNRLIYPEALLASLAEEVYTQSPIEEERKLLEKFFWRCMSKGQ